MRNINLVIGRWRRTILCDVIFLVLAFAIASCAPAPTATPVPSQPTAVPKPPTSAPAPTTAPAVALKSCADGAMEISSIQTSAPVPTATLAPSPTAGGPTATPRPTIPGTVTPRPAPQTDRVGFPENYQTQFKFLFVSDRVATKQVRVVCGNDIAAAAKPGEPYAYGSVLIFESWRPKEDANGNVVPDSKGRLIRDTLTTVFVMRKEKGFGEAYGALRNGEWEYVAYRPDKTISTPPQNTANCAACHLAAGPDKDYILRSDLLFAQEHYGRTPPTAPNEVGMASMAFAPNNLKVKVGTTVKFINSDNMQHNITAKDGSFTAGLLNPGQSYSFTFDKPGTYDYICAIHPEQMTGKIEVVP